MGKGEQDKKTELRGGRLGQAGVRAGTGESQGWGRTQGEGR